ncbi:hypothetical protein ACFL59_05165 [Planctomycetota bacterium]
MTTDEADDDDDPPLAVFEPLGTRSERIAEAEELIVEAQQVLGTSHLPRGPAGVFPEFCETPSCRSFLDENGDCPKCKGKARALP